MPPFEQPLVEGDPHGSVRVVIYENLQCGDCAWLRRKMDEVLLPAFATRAAFEHHDFPLPKHNWARQAAIAARYFQSLNSEIAVAFRREVLGELAHLTVEAIPLWVRAFAKRRNLDPNAAQDALQDFEFAAAVEADYQSGLARAIVKTPTVFIGETVFIERVPMDQVTAALEAALASAGAAR